MAEKEKLQDAAGTAPWGEISHSTAIEVAKKIREKFEDAKKRYFDEGRGEEIDGDDFFRMGLENIDDDFIKKLLKKTNPNEILKLLCDWQEKSRIEGPSLFHIDSKSVNIILKALSEASDTYEYWMSLWFVVYYHHELGFDSNSERILVQALRRDTARFTPYFFLLQPYSSYYGSSVYPDEVEDIVDGFFQNNPQAASKFFFKQLGPAMLEECGTPPNPYFDLAQQYYAAKSDIGNAVRCFEKGLKINPEDIEAPYFYLFEYHLQREDLDEAAKAYQKAILEYDNHNDDSDNPLWETYAPGTLQSSEMIKRWKGLDITLFRKLISKIFECPSLPHLDEAYEWLATGDPDKWSDVVNEIDQKAVNIGNISKIYNPRSLQALLGKTRRIKIPPNLLELRLKLALLYLAWDNLPVSSKYKSGLKHMQIELISDERSLANTLHERELVAERDKIISSLSHSLKNTLSSSVVLPLMSLEDGADPRVVADRALRGADLIRRMVNAMKNTSGGKFEDFIFDARHPDTPSDLKTLIYDALNSSVGNMFDGQNFGKFSRNYFAEYDLFIQAKDEFEKLPEGDFDAFAEFASKYFFDCEVEIADDLASLTIGDAKGSATKIYILFQEMIFNAVKYAGYVPREKRWMKIKMERRFDDIAFSVSNSSAPGTEVKEGGLGLLITKKMCELMNGRIIFEDDEGEFSAAAQFADIWKLAEDEKSDEKVARSVAEQQGDYTP